MDKNEYKGLGVPQDPSVATDEVIPDYFEEAGECDIPLQTYETRIHEAYYYLSKTHRKIANYILKNRASVINSSITVLAGKIGTTPATITRFCQVLRYKGYNELQFYMRNDLLNSGNDSDLLRPDDPLAVSIRKLLKYNLDALNDTMLLLDESKMHQAIDWIMRANKVYFYAEGATGCSAQFGHQLFLQTGIASNCYTDAGLMMLSAAHLTAQDVVICMSFSGASENVYHALEFARRNNAMTIAITGVPKSRLATAANICLLYSCSIQDDIQYLHTARICEVGILGALQTGIINAMTLRKDKRLNALKYAITYKRLK